MINGLTIYSIYISYRYYIQMLKPDRTSLLTGGVQLNYEELLDKYNRLKEDFMELIMKSENICHYCKNDIECKGKDCEKYVEGRGCWDDKRCHHDWAWSCRDFDFGTCDMLENTPCNGCFKNNNEGFEWRGNIV